MIWGLKAWRKEKASQKLERFKKKREMRPVKSPLRILTSREPNHMFKGAWACEPSYPRLLANAWLCKRFAQNLHSASLLTVFFHEIGHLNRSPSNKRSSNLCCQMVIIGFLA